MRKILLHEDHCGRSSRSGFTLVEVMFAMAILAFLALGILSALTFASHMTRLNTNAIAAKNIAQGYFEKMAIDEFRDIGPTHYPDIDDDSNPPQYLDHAMDIRCRVQFAFKGFGTITNASTSNLTDSAVNWQSNEWAGDTVFIVSGQGASQFEQIASNSASTLSLADTLAVAPYPGAKFMINNGKTVEITTTWEYRGRQYSATVESLIVNYRNSAQLGF